MRATPLACMIATFAAVLLCSVRGRPAAAEDPLSDVGASTQNRARVVFVLCGSAVLSVSDPLGTEVKFDYESNRYTEGAKFWADHRWTWDDTLSVPDSLRPHWDIVERGDAPTGLYRVVVTALDDGSFHLEVNGFDVAEEASAASADGTLGAGTSQAYDVHFSAEPGIPIKLEEVRAAENR